VTGGALGLVLAGCLVRDLPDLPTVAKDTSAGLDAEVSVSDVADAATTDGDVLADGVDAPKADADPGDVPVDCEVTPFAPECLHVVEVGFSGSGCARLNSGAVWCWGHNIWGQLGNGTTSDTEVYAPAPVAGLPPVQKIGVSEKFTCALTLDGDVYCWGSNEGGSLGQTTGNIYTSPVQVPLGEKARALFVGFNRSSCVLTVTDNILCWGEQEGEFTAMGPDLETPALLAPLVGEVVQITLGRQTVCVLTKASEAWCAGFGTGGELGDGTAEHSLDELRKVAFETDIPTSIASGDLTTCATVVSPDDPVERVRCWGTNLDFLQGNPGPSPSYVPTEVAGAGPDVRQVAIGWRHVLVVNEDGSLQGWGHSYSGQLGPANSGAVPEVVPIALPVPVASVHPGWGTSCVLDVNGGVWVWGKDDYGQFGRGQKTDAVKPYPELVPFDFIGGGAR